MKYHWGQDAIWRARMATVAKYIPKGISVLDLGGGYCHLKEYLDGNPYACIDVAPWRDDVIVADFNKHEYPLAGLWDVLVAQGILEYLDDPAEFLDRVQQYGRKMILTYRLFAGPKFPKYVRKPIPYVELEKMIQLAGWNIHIVDRISDSERVYILSL